MRVGAGHTVSAHRLMCEFGRLSARVPDEQLRADAGARLEILERHLYVGTVRTYYLKPQTVA